LLYSCIHTVEYRAWPKIVKSRRVILVWTLTEHICIIRKILGELQRWARKIMYSVSCTRFSSITIPHTAGTCNVVDKSWSNFTRFIFICSRNNLKKKNTEESKTKLKFYENHPKTVYTRPFNLMHRVVLLSKLTIT
jgi:hypothetical protein